ncbi:MAG: ABC transporter ATP-binding protein [Firmicutes bacterium]|nr:ABC transporter ATP-binding protein [Bacillota bacterium]
MSGQHNLLEVRNVSREFRVGTAFFGTTIVAVDGVSLRMGSKSPLIVSIVGESGSGKSTLARMILRLLEPTRGQILLNGNDVWAKKTEEELRDFKRTVQPIFQSPHDSFNTLRPVSDALYETAVNLGIAKTRSEADDYIAQTLKEVGLDWTRIRGRYSTAFSGGELQRISIARALLPRPRLIIADEPVSMVDASLRMNIINLFEEFKESFGISFIYVTHDLSTAYYISDEIAIMYRGQIVESGAVADVLTDPRHPYTEMLLASIPGIGGKWTSRIELSGIEVEEYNLTGCKFYPRCHRRLPVCRDVRPQLIPVGNRSVACILYQDSADEHVS